VLATVTGHRLFTASIRTLAWIHDRKENVQQTSQHNKKVPNPVVAIIWRVWQVWYSRQIARGSRYVFKEKGSSCDLSLRSFVLEPVRFLAILATIQLMPPQSVEEHWLSVPAGLLEGIACSCVCQGRRGD
jgi:hypothetical protein